MGDSHTRPTILSLLMGLQLLEPHPVKCSSRDFCTVMHQPSCQRPQSLPRVPLPNLPALQQPKAQPQAEFSVLRFLLAQKLYLLSCVAYRGQKLRNQEQINSPLGGATAGRSHLQESCSLPGIGWMLPAHYCHSLEEPYKASIVMLFL